MLVFQGVGKEDGDYDYHQVPSCVSDEDEIMGLKRAYSVFGKERITGEIYHGLAGIGMCGSVIWEMQRNPYLVTV